MKTSPAKQPIRWPSALLAVLMVALWGGNPVAVQFCLDVLPPIAIAALRFGLAALFMLFWCVAAGNPLVPKGRQWAHALLSGFLMYVQISLFNIGVQYTDSSHTTLLINSYILWVIVIEHLRGDDRVTGRKASGVLLAALGVLLVIGVEATSSDPSTSRDQPSLGGDLVMLASAIVLGVRIVHTRAAVKEMDPGTLILWHDLIGVFFFIATSLAVETVRLGEIDTPALLGLLYQGLLVAGFCFALQAVLLRKHSASQVSVFSFLSPVFGIALAVLLRGDRLTIWLLVAAVFVALGILLVNWQREA